MKKTLLFIPLWLFSISIIGMAQINYPFIDQEGNRDIVAYWYNIPKAIAELSGDEMHLNSSLHIYGKAPGEEFKVKVQVYLKSGEKVFDHIFDIRKEDTQESYSIEQIDGFFKLKYPVEYLEQNPDKIIVTIKSPEEERTKEITCRYHKLSGKVTDFNGNPFKAYIIICPDAFAEAGIGILCDSSGDYEIEVPERTYNSVVAVDKSYGTKSLEAWGWHIIMDSDQRLDFKLGTGEVYNLNVWANNGGGSSYFISFRPMVLFKHNKFPINLNEKEFMCSDLDPILELADITVKVNGKKAEIISLQKYYETGTLETALPAYVVQVSKKGLEITGKQTVMVEYKKETEISGRKVVCNSMGYFQFYLNYNGLSKYF